MSYYKFSATRMNSTTPHTNDRTRKRQKTAPTNTDPDHQHPQQDRNRKEATTTTTTTTNPAPPQDPDETDPPPPPSYYYPRSIVTWNCNGLTARVKKNLHDLHGLIHATQEPDLLCVQEVRMKAAVNVDASGREERQRGTPRSSGGKTTKEANAVTADYYHVQQLLQSPPFQHYRPYWSLADTKYAGTLTLLHPRCWEGMTTKPKTMKTKYDPTTEEEDSNCVAFTFDTAIDVLLRRCGVTRHECGLLAGLEQQNIENANGTEHSTKQKQHHQQASMRSFFNPSLTTTTTTATAVGAIPRTGAGTYTSPHDGPPPPSQQQPHHHVEGRIQYFCFPGMDVIQTYVPNNGSKLDSYRRRQHWDRQVLQFLQQRQQLLHYVHRRNNHNSSSTTSGTATANGSGTQGNSSRSSWCCTTPDRKLLWCGDMNATRDYRDGTHWKRKCGNSSSSGTHHKNEETESDSAAEEEKGEDDVYEWFTDGTQCFSKYSANYKNHTTTALHNRGMPGFTPAERTRFTEWLRIGKFCDIWRTLYPRGAPRPNLSSSSSRTPTTTNEGRGDTTPTGWDRPNYTWRGTPAKVPGKVSKYEGTGMRLDYFLLSPASKVVCPSSSSSSSIPSALSSGGGNPGGRDRIDDSDNTSSLSGCNSAADMVHVESCDILGYGSKLQGLFCGSDHCPVKLTLK